MPSRVLAAVTIGVTVVTFPLHSQSRGRALRIEDYYRIQTVATPSLSPNGRSVSYTVSTRIEDDNSTKTETWIVLSDGCSRAA